LLLPGRAGRLGATTQTWSDFRGENRGGRFQGEICAIADANEWAHGILDPEGEHGDGKSEPCMPHCEHDTAMIDRLYPSLQVPEELDLDDAHLDA